MHSPPPSRPYGRLADTGPSLIPVAPSLRVDGFRGLIPLDVASVLPPLAPPLPDSVSTPQRERPDGGRRVDGRARGERAAVDDEQVGDVVGAVPVVDHRALRIGPHPRRAHVVR